MRIDDDARALEVTLPLAGAARERCGSPPGGPATPRSRSRAARRAAEQARLLDGCVATSCASTRTSPRSTRGPPSDPDLAWARAGAGRLVRNPTVFEEVVKTICTTNCAWSGTVRMVGGARRAPRRAGAAGAPDGPVRPRVPDARRRWPQPSSASTRTPCARGYRGAYLRSLAESVAGGELDLEELGRASREELSDEEIEERLLALPGVGPYAAAHVMMLLGRYSRLVLDSWTRPTYARLTGGRREEGRDDRAALPPLRALRGARVLASLTRDWVDENAA